MKKLLYILLFISFDANAQSVLNRNHLPIDQKEIWLKETVGSGGADLSMGSRTFGTDRTASIQAVLNLANGTGLHLIVHVDDSYQITTKLLTYGNTHVIGIGTGVSGFIGKDSLNTNMIENAHPTGSTTHIDSNIVFENLTINGNGKYQRHDGLQGWVVPIRFTGVNNIVVNNCNIIVPRTFHIWLMNCNNFIINNTNFDWGNNSVNFNQFGNFDGVHLNGPCKNFQINYDRFKCFDDNVAANCDDIFQNTDPTKINMGTLSSYDPYATHGNITDGVSEGGIMMPGDMFGIRMLSTSDSVKRVTFKNWTGKTSLQALIMDNWADGNPSTTGAGYFGDVHFENMAIEVGTNPSNYTYKNSYYCIGGRTQNVTFDVSRRNYSQPTYPTFLFESQGARNVKIRLSDSCNVAVPSISVVGTIDLLDVDYVGITNTSHPNHPLVTMNGGHINRVKYRGDTKYIDNVFDIFSGTGNIDTISINNTTHTGVLAGQGLIKLASGHTMKYLEVSNTVSNLIVSGTGTPTTQAGDWFIDNGLLPIVKGGTGTATPGIVAGTNVTVTGSWPNQTVNSTGGGGGGVTSVATGRGLTGGTITTTGTLYLDTTKNMSWLKPQSIQSTLGNQFTIAYDPSHAFINNVTSSGNYSLTTNATNSSLTYTASGTGGITFNAAGGANIFNTSNTATAPNVAAFLAPSMTTSSSAGQGVYFALGQSLSTNNAGLFQFQYAGSGSSSNNISISLYGTAALFNVYATGIGLGMGATAPSNTYFGIKAGTSSISQLQLSASSNDKTSSKVAGDIWNWNNVLRFYDGGSSHTLAYLDQLAIHGNSTTTGTATTTVTVTIGATMANTTYTVSIMPRDLLTAVNYYIDATTGQTTTTFTVTFVTALTGSINFDWTLNP